MDFVKKYLEDNQITQEEFASKIGVSRHHLSAIVNGRSGISKPVAKCIEVVTGGSLTETMMLTYQRPRKKKKNHIQKS